MKTIFSSFLVLFTSVLIAQNSESFTYTKNHLTNVTNNTILVTAHRASHQDFPENSIAAIQDAIDNHIDIVEIDARVTKDGIPVLMHDDSVDRTTNGTGKVGKFIFSEIEKLKLLQDEKQTSHNVPTLEEALLMGKGKIFFDIDLKVGNSGLKKIIAVVKKCHAENSVIFYDSEYGKIKRVKKWLPEALRMTKIEISNRSFSTLTKINPDLVHMGNDEEDRDIDYINTIKNKYTKPVYMNALGGKDKDALIDVNAYHYFIDKGVQVIQTDHPKLLLEYLIANKKHVRFQ